MEKWAGMHPCQAVLHSCGKHGGQAHNQGGRLTFLAQAAAPTAILCSGVGWFVTPGHQKPVPKPAGCQGACGLAADDGHTWAAHARPPRKCNAHSSEVWACLLGRQMCWIVWWDACECEDLEWRLQHCSSGDARVATRLGAVAGGRPPLPPHG